MSGFRGMGMHRVRWAVDGEPEMQCAACFEYLPITPEFWTPGHGLQRCDGCVREKTRLRTRRAMRRRRADDRAVAQIYDADRYRRNDSVLARYLAAHPERERVTS